MCGPQGCMPKEPTKPVTIRCPNCGQPVNNKSDHIESGGFDDPGTWWYECPEPPRGKA